MSDRRRQYPRLRLAVRLSRWGLSWLEDKDAEGRKLSGFRMILTAFAVGYLLNWPASWSGPAVAALAAIVFGLPVRDLMRAVPASEALGALRAFFDNVMGKAASAVAERAGGYFASTTAWAAAPGEILTRDDLEPPAGQGRPDDV